MRTLALDAATRTGWAFSPGDGGPLSFGALDLLAVCSRKPSRGEKLAAAASAYRDLVARLSPELVVLEAPFGRGIATTRLLYGYAAAVEAAAHEAGAAFVELEPSAARKWVLGRGRLENGKGDVLAWARARGHALGDEQDDEADALLLLEAAADARVEKPKKRRC